MASSLDPGVTTAVGEAKWVFDGQLCMCGTECIGIWYQSTFLLLEYR